MHEVLIDGKKYVLAEETQDVAEQPEFPLPLQRGDKFMENGLTSVWTVDAIYDECAVCSRAYSDGRFVGRFGINARHIRVIDREPKHRQVRIGSTVQYASGHHHVDAFNISGTSIHLYGYGWVTQTDFDEGVEILEY